MAIKLLARTLYALAGLLYLAAGASALLLGTGLLPEAVKKLIIDVSRDDLNAQHIIQEFGSLLIFVGLITFWFVWKYDGSLTFHWAMTLFWGLFALIHWFDIRGRVESAAGPLINTIPFVLFLLLGLLRLKEKAGATPAAAAKEGVT